MKPTLFSLLLCVYIVTPKLVSAQIDPLYAQYLNNPILINPAYTGLNPTFTAGISYRKQWSGFTGNPITLNANAHLSALQNKMGLGCIVLSDKIGNNTNTEVYTTYSYKLVTHRGTLSLGLQSGFVNFQSNQDGLHPYDVSDPAFTNNMNLTRLSIGAGFIYRTDRLLLGASVPRMLKQTSRHDEVITDLYCRHVYATAAYVIFLSSRVRFKPAILMKAVAGAPLSFDYNALMNIDERYTVGLYTRNLNTYGTLWQFKIGSQYQLGYCFEIPANRSIGPRYTTHELSLTLTMPFLNYHDAAPHSF